MKILCLTLLLTVVASLSARAQDAAAMQDEPLPEIKASVQMPKDWFYTKSQGDNLVYQISREKIEHDGDTPDVGLMVSVYTKVPDQTQMKPSAYAEEMLSSTQDETTIKASKATDGPFTTYTVDYKIDSDPAPIHIVTVARANDETGTLYFITWQAPASEEDKLKPIREAILSSLKFDPSF